MPVSRPSTGFPDFATDDYANGLLGAVNVQEPPTLIKQKGWDYGQKPPREYFNWLHRLTNLWIKYTDDQVTVQIPASITALSARVSATELSTNEADMYFLIQQ